MQTKPGIAARNPLFLRSDELERALSLLLQADLSMTSALHAVQQDSGVGAAQIRMLMLIKLRHKIATSELRRLLFLPKQTLSNHVRALSERGLIASEIDSLDKRRHLLSLLAPGLDLVAQVLDRQRRAIGEAYSVTGPEAVSGFTTVLETLVKTFQGGKPGPEA